MNRQDKVEMRFVNGTGHLAAIEGIFGSWFRPEGKDLVFHSPLDATYSVSDQLKWFHSMLKDKRKYIRQFEVAGIPLMCLIRCSGRVLMLEPEALLLGHQLHLQTKIECVG